MNGYPLLKKPKLEREEKVLEEEETEYGTMEEELKNGQEEALIALIEHRTKEVDLLRYRVTYYKSQLDEAEKRLEDTQNKLAHLRGRSVTMPSNTSISGRAESKVERNSASPFQVREDSSPEHLSKVIMKSVRDDHEVARRPPSPFSENGVSSQNQTQSRPKLVITAPNIPQPLEMKESVNKVSSGSDSPPPVSTRIHVNSIAKLKGDKARRISIKQEAVETPQKGTKRKLEGEHKDLINVISKSASSNLINCQTCYFCPSQHKRKLRSLVLCPTNEHLFVTSALDGVVNLWQVQDRGSSANILSTTDCQSNKQRRWPEDIAWHPQGNKLFSVYSADGGDSQVSVLKLTKGKEKASISFLEDKPHTKGIINSITFMPWDNTSFVTGGSDHAVVLWTEKNGKDSWEPKVMHRNHHSSAVMGVGGMRKDKVVMSVGADKRIIGVDVVTEIAILKHQIESKCMSVLPNPCDFNLFMVQTGMPERQLRLFDLRLKQEIHSFGWKQESSESQSALINQAWSPDGLYITSGSADPFIHIFDIRYNAHTPSQSIRAHQKRVFKAAWHHALPILISISSDLNIGLHKIT
ncbi:hypothetical protein ACJIZ3_004379 [Penstemon smallii]|uniref:Uncharacterized protein n=1 Tax=Penstemon smallii TaxID=265156 RepID=A0ABD3S1W2_9LAMI